MSEPPPANGRALGLLNAVKTMSLTNVLTIAALVVIAVPAYLAYRVISDPVMMDRLMSQYKEVKTDTPCLLREVKQRGGPDLWGISTGFAFFGSAKWFISVNLNHEPTAEEIASHCEVLQLTIDWMRDPAEHKMPTVPGSNSPLVWQYPLEDGGFHRDEP